MKLYGIDTRNRAVDFLAQVGHESLGLKFATEIWGPEQVPEQKTYERDMAKPWGSQLVKGDRNFKAYGLGNGVGGDGFRFRGRGWIMCTGRANYGKVRDSLRSKLGTVVPDFQLEPDALALPQWAALSAADFWDRNRLNRFADVGDDASFIAETRVINGGTNGLADRQERRRNTAKALP